MAKRVGRSSKLRIVGIIVAVLLAAILISTIVATAAYVGILGENYRSVLQSRIEDVLDFAFRYRDLLLKVGALIGAGFTAATVVRGLALTWHHWEDNLPDRLIDLANEYLEESKELRPEVIAVALASFQDEKFVSKRKYLSAYKRIKRLVRNGSPKAEARWLIASTEEISDHVALLAKATKDAQFRLTTAYLAEGRYFERRNQMDKASEAFAKLNAAANTDIDAYSQVAAFFRRAGKLVEEEKALERLLDVSKDDRLWHARSLRRLSEIRQRRADTQTGAVAVARDLSDARRFATRALEIIQTPTRQNLNEFLERGRCLTRFCAVQIRRNKISALENQLDAAIDFNNPSTKSEDFPDSFCEGEEGGEVYGVRRARQMKADWRDL